MRCVNVTPCYSNRVTRIVEGDQGVDGVVTLLRIYLYTFTQGTHALRYAGVGERREKNSAASSPALVGVERRNKRNASDNQHIVQ